MLLTFGEIMLRLSHREPLTLNQMLPGMIEATFGGAESNVAFSYSRLGGRASFVTALPDNKIARSALAQLKSQDVDVSKVKFVPDSRMGIFYLEKGANQRPSSVTYDRAHSAFSECSFSDEELAEALQGADRVHITGITPALSKSCFEASKRLVEMAHQRGVKVSCDLNFRNRLWKWKSGTGARELARECMPEIIKYADIVIGNEEDAYDVLNIALGNTDLKSGKLDLSQYSNVARAIVEKFPNVKRVALTLRESVSADYNRWGAMMFDAEKDQVCYAPLSDGQYKPYEIRDIVDRVGGGDSFAAGLLYALDVEKFATNLENLSFAVASSCLAHSIFGDYNYATKPEVMNMMKGSVSGRVQR